MNKEKLQATGFAELSEAELKKTDGGLDHGAFSAGQSAGRYVGKALGALALLAFCFT
ncbi:MAG: hypothetical protein E6772_11700 [Dysgonomonas sp.]|nr:hypothetical protein [Dysgonomonas sp.]